MPDPRRKPLPAALTRISWASVLTQGAEHIALAATPLAAVLLFHAGATETALLQVAQTLPFLMLAIPLGLIVDRHSRKRTLIASEALRALTLTGVLILVHLNALTFTALLVLGLVGAIGTVGFSIAAPAAVPELVEREQLVDANRRLELGRSIAFISGPALGGALVALAGAGTAFTVATIICCAALTLLARTIFPHHSPTPKGGGSRDVLEGLSFTLRNDVLRPVLVTSLIFNIGWFLVQSVFAVYALEKQSMTPTMVGAAMGTVGIGMVIGAFVMPWLSRRLALGRISVLGPLGGFVAAGLITATVWMPSPPLVYMSFFLFGFGPVLWSISTTTVRQAITPQRLIGRVSSLLVVTTYGARPIGAGLGVLIAAIAGMEACLILALAVFALQLVVVLVSKLPSVRSLPEPAVLEA